MSCDLQLVLGRVKGFFFSKRVGEGVPETHVFIAL